MSSSDTSSSNQSQLLRLPWELLSIVCSMALQQDRDFELIPVEPLDREGADGWSLTPDYDAVLRSLLKAPRLHGNSLNSLFATCRRLREAATPFLFETVTLHSFCAEVFSDIIRPHRHHVRTLLLYSESIGRNDDTARGEFRVLVKQFIKFSHNFVNLSSLDFHGEEIWSALHNMSDEVASGQTVDARDLAPAFNHLGTKIRALQLDFFVDLEKANLIASLPALQEVRFEPWHLAYWSNRKLSNMPPGFCRELSTLRNLKVMLVTGQYSRSRHSFKIPLDWATLNWECRHTLSTLELTNLCVDETFWSFLAIFSGSLKTLKTTLDKSGDAMESRKSLVSMPLLEDLDIRSNLEGMDAFLNAFAASPLKRVFLRIADMEGNSNILLQPSDQQLQLLTSVRHFFPTLRQLHLDSTNRQLNEYGKRIFTELREASLLATKSLAVTYAAAKMTPSEVASFYSSKSIEAGHGALAGCGIVFEIPKTVYKREYNQEDLNHGIADLLEFATRKAKEVKDDLQGAEKLFMDLIEVWKQRELDIL